jgi:hypothetical protein
MYPDNAYYEFYPADIVDKILAEHPDATVERKNRLMQALWDTDPRNYRPSMAELADDLGL